MIKKKEDYRFIIITFLIIIMLSFTSAGLLDWIEKTITGKDVESIDLNISVGAGNAPQIVNVTNISTLTLTVGPGSTYINVNFSVSDSDGVANLNSTSGTINLTKEGSTSGGRYNTTCIQKAASGNLANYSCDVYMYWFDLAGGWYINTSITDLSNNIAYNDTNIFSVQSTTGFVAGPTPLSFGTINAGSTNNTATDILLLNNTGNVNITNDNILINATDLKGENDNLKALYSGNFSVGLDNTGSNECSNNTGQHLASVMNLTSGFYATLTGANISAGNYTVGNGVLGQEQLYVCLRYAGSELSQQAYSTAEGGAWTIQAT